MAFIKKPPEIVTRSVRLEQPVSELLDQYCRFVECTPDYVVNFALRKILSRDPEYKKWRAAQSAAPQPKAPAPNAVPLRTS